MLNTHGKRHNPPFKCPASQCSAAFRYRKDLTRHQMSKHADNTEPGTRLYCPYSGCKFSYEKGRGSARKDNLSRHVQSQHGGQL
ncbi:unnamed protein product [Periconia digitata]|uniref:C2H2-type domain-containing protein n=1 Tax=Periconia digitata TaxID=1303443 RepID=A0A9W4XKD8_9PLEO|nr:unnamed protein product [Periconia digitata]